MIDNSYAIKSIKSYLESVEEESRNQEIAAYKYFPPIFRGQSDSTWEIKTTLERENRTREYKVKEYLRVTSLHAPEINSVENTNFSNSLYNLDQNIFTPDKLLTNLNSDVLAYFIYLRHFSFPSPLLDWTRSLYIALYFACSENLDKNGQVIIVNNRNLQAYNGDQASLFFLDMPINATRRHFNQKACYSIATKWTDQMCYFCNTEEAIYGSIDNFLFEKFTIPSDEKISILKDLDSMNINANSLLGGTESLMKTLSNRIFHF